MIFDDFLNFNDLCPSCGEPLHLYMGWYDAYESALFEAVHIDDGLYKFDGVFPSNLSNVKSICLTNKYDGLSLSFESIICPEPSVTASKLKNNALKSNIYFFFLCNKSGVKDKFGYDYEIDLYKGCYFRSSCFYESSNIESNLIKLVTNSSLININEAFSFSKIEDEMEKVYMLGLDYESSQTTFWHYSIPIKEKYDRSLYEPNMFEKKLPLSKNRLNFDVGARDQLFKKFDSWILLS